ncbi:MAG: penicillin acylase family protein [Deltaproteobacteria bacterium]|uniref:Penicillin acylase family protein n=1 Tax=Candidatus Zymogenus saltonus TaxID=2844893 RepID=A0A9D8PPP9_9DELT|nr:penicillin acylase family protein [Candidatus Zymogenus saltonus]
MKVVKWLVFIVLALVVIVFVGAYGYLKSTLPEYNGEIKTEMVKGKVEIIRDSYGMPHIYAENERDLSFALGYAMAQDRMFQMDMIRRAIRGKLSEILGESLVPVDKLFITITAAKSVEGMYEEMPEEVKSNLEAFSEGVNYFLDNHKGPLTVEFKLLGYEPEHWVPSDCIAPYYFMAWDLNGSFGKEMLYLAIIEKLGEDEAKLLFPDYVSGAPTIIPKGTASLEFLKTMNLAREVLGTEGGGVSNNWLISGVKSETGMPILANDMHLGLAAPGIWYEAHLVAPDLNVSGVLVPGIPLVVVGANEHVAWGFTNVMADDADYYIEKINPENPNQYQYMGKWLDMEVQEKTIAVKGKDDVKFDVKLTRHGPIIDEVNNYEEKEGHSLSMRWTASELNKVPVAMYYFDRAESIDDMEKAVEYFKCPGQNIIYADDQGNVGYWASVGIPIRTGFDGMLPVPGWDGNHEWGGYVPTKIQPHLRNPSMGWIVTANNKHVGDDYPYVISNYYAVPDRYVRISEMIEEKEKLGVSDFQEMHADFLVVLARDWVPNILIIEALSSVKLTETETAALNELKEWDFVATPSSRASTIFHATVNNMIKNTFKNRIGDDFYEEYLKNNYVVLNTLRNEIAKGESVWFDDPATVDKVEGLNDVIVKSFREAVAYLELEMGKNVDDWKWGEIHTVTMYHAFGKKSKLMGFFMNVGPSPMGGSIATVDPQPYRLNSPWEIYHGASMRYIIDLQDMKKSLRVIPVGISGNFMSPHYDDQFDLWRTVTYRPFVLDREDVDNDARYTLVIGPAE